MKIQRYSTNICEKYLSTFESAKKRVAEMNIKYPVPFAKVVEVVIIHNED